MTTPIGLDFGNYHSYVCAAQRGNLDVLANEVSNRSTPSLVGFSFKNRYLGETAKSNEVSNLKNTVGSLQRIIGRAGDDPEFLAQQKFVSAKLEAVDGQAGAEVTYKGEKRKFTATQLTGMYLNKIKQTAISETKSQVSDICIAVPVWYNEQQRLAIKDAAAIAGLNCVRVANDVTAAAVGWGVFKNNDLPEEKPKLVCFVDVGHSSYTVSVVAFKKGECKVLGTAYDQHFGGRDFDALIAANFAEIFKKKYKIDVTTNPKAAARVMAQSERLKKILSANSSAPFNIESVMNDVDVSSSMTREELEEAAAPLLKRAHIPVELALKRAGVTAEQIDNVEVIGGSSRIPSVKDVLSKVFDKPLSYTANAEESTARGAAFICAMHSPTMRVRPFKFEDYNLNSVTYSWTPVEGEDVSELEVFPEGGFYPNTKVITLHRAAAFDVTARYTNPETLPEGTNQFICKWTVSGMEGKEPAVCKLKLRQDPSGIFTIEDAYVAEEVEVEEPIEGAEPAEEGGEIPTQTVKKWVKKNDLKIDAQGLGLSQKQLQEQIELENSMIMEDKLVADTEDRKNALEEYIYEMRGKLEDIYADFASDAEKANLREKMEKIEDWLYGAGEDAKKALYIAKYEELASIGNLIKGRYNAKQEEERQAKVQKKEAANQAKLAEMMAAKRKEKKDADGDVEVPDVE